MKYILKTMSSCFIYLGAFGDLDAEYFVHSKSGIVGAGEAGTTRVVMDGFAGAIQAKNTLEIALVTKYL